MLPKSMTMLWKAKGPLRAAFIMLRLYRNRITPFIQPSISVMPEGEKDSPLRHSDTRPTTSPYSEAYTGVAAASGPL